MLDGDGSSVRLRVVSKAWSFLRRVIHVGEDFIFRLRIKMRVCELWNWSANVGTRGHKDTTVFLRVSVGNEQ